MGFPHSITKSVPQSRVILKLLVFLSFVCFSSIHIDAGQRVSPEQSIRVIVQFSNHLTQPSQHARNLAQSLDGNVKQTFRRVLSGAAIRVPVKHLGELEEKETVKQVYQDRLFRISGRKAPGNMRRINAAPRESYPEHDNVNVAVLDTGIDRDHPDLTVNIEDGISVVGKHLEDLIGHGTHVAGIIAARRDQEGITGVAPRANLYPVKVAENRFGFFGDLIAGMDWVLNSEAHDKIDLINMSVSGKVLPGERPIRTAVNKTAGDQRTIVAPAGNQRERIVNVAPAMYEHVMTVSALGKGKKQFSSFSNYGKAVDFTGPGERIRSTTPDGYAIRSGTSIAAAHATGVAALMVGLTGEASGQKIERMIKRNGIRKNWIGDGDQENEPLINARFHRVRMIDVEPAGVENSSLTGITPLNVDDDNGSGIEDRYETGFQEPESDFFQLHVDVSEPIKECDTRVTVNVDKGQEHFRLWKTRHKNNRVNLPKTWDSRHGDDMPDDVSFWGEGIKTSDTMKDVRFAVRIERFRNAESAGCTETTRTVHPTTTIFEVKRMFVHKRDRETAKVDSTREDAAPREAFSPHKHFVTAYNQGDVILNADVAPNDQKIKEKYGSRFIWRTVKLRGNEVKQPAIEGEPLSVEFSTEGIKGKVIPMFLTTGTRVGLAMNWIVHTQPVITLPDIVERQMDQKTEITFDEPLSASNLIDPMFMFHTGKDADVPDLKGKNQDDPPGGTHYSGGHLKNGAEKMWDASRQIRVKFESSNPDLSFGQVFTKKCARECPRSYPDLKVKGNDDPGTESELNNPYQKKIHGIIGENNVMNLSADSRFGKNGDTVTLKLHFRSFARLNLPGVHGDQKWFAISDPEEGTWRFHARWIKKDGVWEANNPVLEKNNRNWGNSLPKGE